MPRWGEDTAEWAGFLADIREAGIRHPLQITGDNLVVDGETRRRAAVALGMEEVPVVVVEDNQISTIILRELARRRNLTKGQLAYLLVPRLQEAFEEAQNRRALNAAKTNATELRSFSDNTDELAASFGISRETLNQARRLREELAAMPERRAEFEAQLFHPHKPIGLGKLLRGIGFLREQKARGGAHDGGRPSDPGRRLALFERLQREEETRWEYFNEADDSLRQQFWQRVRLRALAQPADYLVGRSRYHERMAKELRAAVDRPSKTS